MFKSLLGFLFLLVLTIIIVIFFVKISKLFDFFDNKFSKGISGRMIFFGCSCLALLLGLIILGIIIVVICWIGDAYLYQPLKQLHNANNHIVTVLIAIFFFLINNFAFSMPKFLSLDDKYSLTESARITQLLISIWAIAFSPAAYFWQSWTPSNILGLPKDLSYFAVLVTYFGYWFMPLAFISMLLIAFFRGSKCLFNWMLQPKSANFAKLSSNHYDVDDLLKNEQEYESTKEVLDKKIWKLSLKNTNNLYK